MELVVGILSSLLSEGAKRWSKVPLNPDNTKAVRAVVIVLSIAGTVLTAWTSGQLQNVDWTTLLNQGGDAVTSFAAATGVYHIFLKEKK